jgi:glutamyl-tRNA reductase
VSVLVVGVSHRTAPVALLERTVLQGEEALKLLADVVDAEHVDEAIVLTTCNRLEVYADVRKFHGGVQDVTDRIVDRTGVPFEDLTDHLYVHYEDRAVQHLFEVAAGLDSMVVGEHQILGQLRDAAQAARENGTVGRGLGQLADHALHSGKRVHTETGIDRAGRSLVSVGLDLAAASMGGLDGRSVVIVGAGSMSSLTGTTLRRRGVDRLTIVNRTPARGHRLAEALTAVAADPAQLREHVADADLLVSCTGAVGTVVSTELVQQAMSARPDRPLFVLDLALPRDVEHGVGRIAGVTLVDLDTLRSTVDDAAIADDVDAARRIVTDEVASYLTKQRSERVAPTVAALRARAQEVVDAELERLRNRVPGLDERAEREITTTVGRVVDKLLHAPTVRVKELAAAPGGDSYADVLRELFALDAAATEAVTRADVVVEEKQ